MTVCAEVPSRRPLQGNVFAGLRTAVGQPAFDSWFAALRIEGIHGTTCHVSVPTRFLSAWIQERYPSVLLEVVQRYDRGIQEVQIAVRRPVPKARARPEPEQRESPLPSEERDAAVEVVAEPLDEQCRDEPPIERDLWVGKIAVAEIQRVVGKHYGVSRADILSPRRTGPLIRPRHIAIYLSKQLTLHSLPAIGRLFAGRDHTSVLHAIRKIESLLPDDPALQETVYVLSKQLIRDAAMRRAAAEHSTTDPTGEDALLGACHQG